MTDAITSGVPRTLADMTDKVNILYYGEQGTGKTLDLATLGLLGPIIYVNAEGGLKRRPLRRFGVDPSNIIPEPATSYEQLEGLYWKLRRQIEADDPSRPIGINFDSLTEITTTLAEVATMRRVHAVKEKADNLGIVAEAEKINPFRTALDDYGIMTTQMRHLCRRFRDLDMHVGFSALSRRDVDASGGGEAGDTVTYRPALTPAFGNDIRGYVDIVVATKVASDGRWVGITKPRFGLMGKDRFDALPPVMVDPTYERIIKLVNDELDPDECAWVPSA